MAKGLVRACHTAFEIMGKPAGKPRPPIQALGNEDTKRLEALLAALGDPPARQVPRAAAAE